MCRLAGVRRRLGSDKRFVGRFRTPEHDRLHRGVRRDGETITVSDTETILGRCIEVGIAQEYSCRVGMCLAHSAEIVEGGSPSPRHEGFRRKNAKLTR